MMKMAKAKAKAKAKTTGTKEEEKMPETGQKSAKSDLSKIGFILGQKLTYNETPKKANPQSVSFSAN